MFFLSTQQQHQLTFDVYFYKGIGNKTELVTCLTRIHTTVLLHNFSYSKCTLFVIESCINLRSFGWWVSIFFPRYIYCFFVDVAGQCEVVSCCECWILIWNNLSRGFSYVKKQAIDKNPGPHSSPSSSASVHGQGHVIVTVSVIVIVIVIITELTVNTQCCGGTSCICFMFRFTLVSMQIVRFNMSSRIKRLEWTTEFAIS